MTKLKIFLSTLMVLPILVGVLWVAGYAQAQSAPSFRTGDIATGTNNTRGDGSWVDPVSARPGEAIEFRIVAQNMTPNSTANNVVVRADLPSNRTNPEVMTGYVSADNAATVSDTVTVNIEDGSQQGFAYIPGHTRIFSNACPNGCAGPDTITSGINVGNLGFGESAQVLFKAYVTNIVSPSPSPTPTPTPGVQCPNVQFVLPSNIQPNSTIVVRVNTSGGQNWAYVTLKMDNVYVEGGNDLGGGSFEWRVNSGAAGSTHSLEFRVNDLARYNLGSETGQVCGTSSFTTGQAPASPTPTPTATPTPTPTPGGQGGNTNNNNNQNNNNNENTNVNVNNGGNSSNTNTNTSTSSSSSSATGGAGGSGGSSTVNLTIPSGGSTTIVVPSGVTGTRTTTTSSTSSVASATTSKGAPKVVATAGNQEVVELPKTGLPLLAWGLAGLLPVGLKLRGKKNNLSETSANSLWEERQFKI